MYQLVSSISILEIKLRGKLFKRKVISLLSKHFDTFKKETKIVIYCQVDNKLFQTRDKLESNYLLMFQSLKFPHRRTVGSKKNLN